MRLLLSPTSDSIRVSECDAFLRFDLAPLQMRRAIAVLGILHKCNWARLTLISLVFSNVQCTPVERAPDRILVVTTASSVKYSGAQIISTGQSSQLFEYTISFLAIPCELLL